MCQCVKCALCTAEFVDVSVCRCSAEFVDVSAVFVDVRTGVHAVIAFVC